MALLLGKYETHPAADLFPLMDEDALARLAEDIEKHGQREPVVMHEGKVLDGRNRLLACDRIGIGAESEEWEGVGSPVEWVLSKNLHRRHLTESQRAMVAAASLPMLKEEAKERQRAAGGDHRSEEAVSANLPEAVKGEAREKAAEIANVSPRSVAHAAKVIARAVPELADAVRAGEVAVSAAAQVADEPEERQRALVAAGPKAIKEAAKAKRERTPEPEPELDRPRLFIERMRAAAKLENPRHVRALLLCALECLNADTDDESERLGRTFDDQLLKYRAG